MKSTVLDYETLVDRCVGNADFAERILNKFMDRFDTDVEQLDRGLSQQNGEQVAQVAHRIKGAAASISAVEVSQVAADIERLARADQLEEVPAGLSRLQEAWARLVQSVEESEFINRSVS